MQLVRRKFITKNITWLRYLVYFFFVVALGMGFAQQVPTSYLPLEIIALGALFFMFSLQVFLNKYNLSQRDAQLQKVIATNPEYTQVADKGDAWWFTDQLGAIDELHGARDPRMTNVISTPEWTYGDFTYNLYGQFKNSEYVKARVYYGVMTTKLPRDLPNVFFDSVKARRRQFRLHFAKEQRHSLEGDFDKFFVTYFPDGYTIDSMSFISPEVMWAMREASDYDIEIYKNRLFLYGPLFDPEQQLKDMSSKILEIKRRLAEQAVTYRDERLPFEQGRKRVSAEAVDLKLSKFWTYASIGTFVGYILLRIALEIWSN